MSSIILYTIHEHAHTDTYRKKPPKHVLYTVHTTRTKWGLWEPSRVYSRDLLYFSFSRFEDLLCCAGRFQAWFFHWVIILLFVMHCGVEEEKKMGRKSERCVLMKWWRAAMRKYMYKNKLGCFRSCHVFFLIYMVTCCTANSQNKQMAWSWFSMVSNSGPNVSSSVTWC